MGREWRGVWEGKDAPVGLDTRVDVDAAVAACREMLEKVRRDGKEGGREGLKVVPHREAGPYCCWFHLL